MGKPVPAVSVADKGEMQLRNGQIHYQTWNSQSLTGKARLLIHVAGRLSAKEQSAGLISAIQQASLPENTFQTTTIVNTDDALPGSSIFVVNSIRASKKRRRGSSSSLTAVALPAIAGSLNRAGRRQLFLTHKAMCNLPRHTLSADDISQIISLLRVLTR